MLHRFRQFTNAGRLPTPRDFALARQWLEPPLFELFAAQHPRDAVHTAATARWLLERGYDDPHLLQAAFLHDIGKGEQRRFDRTISVIAQASHLEARLASASSRFPVRRAIERSRTHSESGARTLEAARASERVIDLTRRHHGPPGTDPVLALLQEADTAT